MRPGAAAGPTGRASLDLSRVVIPADEKALLFLGAALAVIPLYWAAVATVDAIRKANPDAVDCDGVCCLEEHRTGKLGRCRCSWRCRCRYEGQSPPPLETPSR